MAEKSRRCLWVVVYRGRIDGESSSDVLVAPEPLDHESLILR
jgi:hypothetical protein